MNREREWIQIGRGGIQIGREGIERLNRERVDTDRERGTREIE